MKIENMKTMIEDEIIVRNRQSHKKLVDTLHKHGLQLDKIEKRR